ncbi:MAG: aminotransferase class V-fold PLP-dependent enzyme, partial [Rhizobiales bacterium]|nr:aminotransferase class V-fold PLP-dependent enzyme [Hyphomicrobiales bacterium]
MRTYLDHNATSTLRPEAHLALTRALAHSANPSSVHRDGQKARALVEDAREVLAAAIGRAPTEIVFTSGGTEACSLAIAGAVRGLGIGRIVASAIEHAAVLEAARASGARLEIAPVTTDGVVDLAALDALLADGNSAATLICVMAANNETGAIQPMDEVAGLARTYGALLFCDAVQALG